MRIQTTTILFCLAAFIALAWMPSNAKSQQTGSESSTANELDEQELDRLEDLAARMCVYMQLAESRGNKDVGSTLDQIITNYISSDSNTKPDPKLVGQFLNTWNRHLVCPRVSNGYPRQHWMMRMIEMGFYEKPLFDHYLDEGFGYPLDFNFVVTTGKHRGTLLDYIDSVKLRPGFKTDFATKEIEELRYILTTFYDAKNSSELEFTPERFVRALESSAIKGDMQSQYEFGLKLLNSGKKRDSMEWFQKAAAQGHAEAKYEIGALYAESGGHFSSPDNALKWLLPLASEGHTSSWTTLGIFYSNDSISQYDPILALMWTRKAAQSGKEPYAADLLSIRYYYGNDVEQNSVKALMWYLVSIELSGKQADYIDKLRVARITDNLSDEEVGKETDQVKGPLALTDLQVEQAKEMAAICLRDRPIACD